MVNQLAFLTVNEMARGLRERQFSAVELLDAHLDQYARWNPQINALVTLDAEKARESALAADQALQRGETWGPLHGIPVAMKDVWATRGMRTTASTPRLSDYVPDADATVVERVKSAGAIVIGKTNLPELAMGTQTNSPIFGTTNNPWDLSRTPGGSTGGGAAAVAAGLSAFEIGSDLAGSIRIPAHYCGVFGLKTTNHRVPATGHIPPMPGHEGQAGLLGNLVCFGPLARSVQDLELILEILAGPDGKQLDVPPVPFKTVCARDWKQYRVAFSDCLDIPVSDEIRSVIRLTASALEQAGCQVEEARPPYLLLEDAMETYGMLLGAGLAASGMGMPLPAWALRMLSKIEKSSSMSRGYLHGMAASLKEYSQAVNRQYAMLREIEHFLEHYDAWILPVSSTPAFRHIEMKDPNSSRLATIEVNGKPLNYFPAVSGHVTPFNVSGHPAAVLPAGWSKENLPIGIQVVARRWNDAELLALAGKLSQEITGQFCPPMENQ
jgi:amidase